MYSFTIVKSPNKTKKYRVYLKKDGYISAIDFGAEGYKDFIKYNISDPEKANDKKRAYIARHKDAEDWSKKGIDTAGFWARWILWNKPTLEESIRNVAKTFNLNYEV